MLNAPWREGLPPETRDPPLNAAAKTRAVAGTDRLTTVRGGILMELSLVDRSMRAGGVETDASKRVCSGQQIATLNLLGMTLAEITPPIEAGCKRSSLRGVAVLVVGWDSDAYREGIRSGDIIAEINHTKIRSLKDIVKVLRLHDPRDPLLVLMSNDGGWRCTALSFAKRLPWECL
jgi:hypothetical protein